MLKKIGLLLLCLFLTGADYLGRKQIEVSKSFMGSIFQITVFDSSLSKEQLSYVVDQAFVIIGKMDNQMSDQKEGSLTSRIHLAKEGDAFELDEDTFYMLKESFRVTAATGEVLDLAGGALKSLWVAAKEKAEPPSKEAIAPALLKTGNQALHLEPETKKLIVQKEGASLSIEEVAKGYAVDNAARYLKEQGVVSAIISADNSVRLIGPSQEGRSWRLGIEHPRDIDRYAAVLSLEEEGAVATLGDYDNFFIFKDKRYPLILDPKTGAPPDNHVASVTVVAKNMALANILSRVFFILGPEKGFELVEQLKEEGIEVIFIEEKPDQKPTLSCSEKIQGRLADIQL